MERSLEVILLKSRENRELKLQLQCLNLNEIPDLKEYEWVHELNLGHNNINKIDNFPESLIKIDLSKNNFNNLPKLNNNLKKIDFSFNNIDILPDFPDLITHINGNKNSIKEINKLPSSLEILELKDNRIS